jgi:hypothetical protein
MKLDRMLKILRMHLNDTQKVNWVDDEELIEFLDRASSFLTDRLISMRYNSLIKKITLDGPTELPKDFVAFVGKVPVEITGNVAEVYAPVDIATHRPRWDDPNVAKNPNIPMWGGTPVEDFPYDSWDDLTTTHVVTLKYWSRLAFPSTFVEIPEEELPYTADQATLIIDMARMFALNKNSYDITQDLAIMGQLQQAMAQARGVADEND